MTSIFFRVLFPSSCLISLVFAAQASDKVRSEGNRNYLFDGARIESGLYLAPIVKYSQLLANEGVFMGLRGAWIANHSWVVGASVVGLATDHFPLKSFAQIDSATQLSQAKLGFTYGGLLLEYIVGSTQLIHFSVGTTLGAGYLYVKEKTPLLAGAFQPQSVLVVEPEVFLILNLYKGVQTGLGAGYRIVRGSKVAQVSNSDLSGLNIGFQIQFGIF